MNHEMKLPRRILSHGGPCNGVILTFNYLFYANLWFSGKKETLRNDYAIGILIT